MSYKATIGLEIHVQLKTRTKMFCNSLNDPDEIEPNVNICPICVGHPGTLPSINKEAVKKVLQVGVALGGELADYTEFDRKNYFYPDIPKGYQISQYQFPLVSGGELSGVGIERIHLEEDTARLVHESDSDGEEEYSLLDYNRAGVPLMELVTKPVMHSAEEAGKFARELQLLLRKMEVSDADMEKGQMRVEANVSVSKDANLGTKTEVKNINSFKAAEKAILFEIKRQTEVIESGGKVVQETRGWSEDKGATFSQRQKEESHDYRYFPDPDLPKIIISQIKEFSLENLGKDIPELPNQTRDRFKSNYGIKDDDIEFYLRDEYLKDLFEDTVGELKDKEVIQLASNYITTDLAGMLAKDPKRALDAHLPRDKKIDAKNLGRLIEMISHGDLSSRGAKDTLEIMYREGGNPEDIAKEKNLLQISDESQLREIVKTVINENEASIEGINDNDKAEKFLIGKVMAKSGGRANPEVASRIISENLKQLK